MNKKFLSLGLLSLTMLGITSCDSNTESSNQTSDIAKDTYSISFYFDGTLYETKTLEKGKYLTDLPEVPTKDGYTVSWNITDFSNIQTDTTVEAILVANSYDISYYLNDELLEVKSFKYGEEVTSPTVTTEDGTIFTGFSGLPTTMGASNIAVYGYTYQVDEVININTFEDDFIFEITSKGTYYFTGDAKNFGISVNTEDEVNIYLEDINVTELNQAFIYVEKASNVNVVSSNVLLSDLESNVDEAIIVSNSPITLSGSGSVELTSLSGLGVLVNKTSLTFNGGDYIINSKSHGIQAKGKGATITINGASYDITSIGTSIKAKSDITISNANIICNSQSDAINTEGEILINSGNFNLTSLTDAIQGDSKITINGGEFNLSSGGGTSSNATLTTTGDFVFEEEDTLSFTTDEEYYGLYVLVNNTYIELDEDNYSTYKNYTVFYDKKSQRGLKSDGEISILGGTISIDSLDDGIKTDTTFIQSGGSISITSKSDGIQGDENIEITGGVITINTEATFYQNSSGKYKKSGTTYYKVGSDETSGTLYDMYTSTKGLKSDSLIYITNGNINIISDDDSIHSDEYITILGGTFNLETLDDGMHADSVLSIGTNSDSKTLNIDIVSSYEGLEGASVYIYYGTINITAKDDGINAAGGSDSTTGNDIFKPGGMQGGFHKSSTTGSTTEEYNIYISGGDIVIDASGDGIDSNGSIYISGGNTFVFGPSDSGNAAIDYGDTSSSGLYVTGGSIVAIGTSGMAVYPTSGNYVAFTLRSSLSVGSTVSIVDESNNEIASFTTTKSCNSIIIAGENVLSGTKYTLVVNGSNNTTANSTSK